jgi:transcriptional regulator with XRE-family HTH domain
MESLCNGTPAAVGPSAAGIGAKLHAIRRKWQLSLREVEQRSVRLAKDRNNPSYQISAGWLNRLEREEHELTVSKLAALSEIYNVPMERLLHSTHSEDQNLVFDPVAQPPDETTLLSPEVSMNSSYLRGIVGNKDCTSEPMIPPGSIVYIDTKNRAISLRKDWAHEFQRPIYFLKTPHGYVCGWCEMSKDSEWLTVIPHPMSPVGSRRWRYRTEINCVGRVVFVAVRFAEFLPA